MYQNQQRKEAQKSDAMSQLSLIEWKKLLLKIFDMIFKNMTTSLI